MLPARALACANTSWVCWFRGFKSWRPVRCSTVCPQRRRLVTLGTLDVMQSDIRHLRNKISIEPGKITITGRIMLRGNL
jgi:hypothetical protein